MGKTIGVLIIFLFSISGQAQDLRYSKEKGIVISSADSLFFMNMGVRFQTLYRANYGIDEGNFSDRFLIRRARLKFDGHAYSKKWVYKIELGLSNSDIGPAIPENNTTANVILDAILKYKFHPGWEFWLGQAKLPGNRERVISSQKLQFVDRSAVNGRFNIDRGMSIQLHHKHEIGRAVFKEIVSMSTGDGRNLTVDNIGGYEYTLRFEYQPFGSFADKGDYFGSDLVREPKPKLSIGVVYDQNNNASRARGFTGDFYSEYHDLKTYFVDAMFKYNGFSAMFEYANKRTDGSPVTSEGAFYTGNGVNFQSGYLFINNFEIAGRYTDISPEKTTGYDGFSEYTLGMSKYIEGHKLKVQSDLTYRDQRLDEDAYIFRFQVEFAF